MKMRLLRLGAGTCIIVLTFLIGYLMVTEGIIRTIVTCMSAAVVIVGMIIGLNIAFGRREDFLTLWRLIGGGE